MLLLSLAARADERRIAIEVVDAVTRKPASCRCALMRGDQTRVHRHVGPKGRVFECVPGDKLYMFHRAYDLRVVRIKPSTPDRVRVELKPARAAAVVLKGTTPQQRRGLKVEVVYFTSGSSKGPDLSERHQLDVSSGTARVWAPAGMRTMLDVTGKGVIAWPPASYLRPGETTELRLDHARDVPVAWPAGSTAESRTVLCLADRQAAVPGPALRTDAWRWHTNGPGWRIGSVASDGLRLLPDVACHLFTSDADGPRYRYGPRGVAKFDLSGAADTRLLEWPEVDGRPVPDGTWIGVGALDLTALYQLRSADVRGCVAIADRARWGLNPPRLAAAPALTLWHRTFGLAHAEWKAGAVPRAKSHPARIKLMFPGGVDVAGGLVAYPIWRGTGGIDTKPPCEKMMVTFHDARAAVFPGVRAGAWYGVLVQVAFTDRRTGRVRRIDRKLQVKTPERGGVATIRID